MWKEAYLQAYNILKAGRYARLARQAEQIQRWVAARKFSVVVAGEFGLGKSRFINELLGRAILPVRSVPTTTLCTVVTYHQKEMLVHVAPDGKKTGYPLKEASWRPFLSQESGEDPKGSLYVGLDLPWLAQHRLELVDTPGTGNFVEQRTNLAEQALARADGVILIISAGKPFSSTERAWIQSQLLAREVPRIMVVITKLDQIEEESRARVVTYIWDKVREISPAVEVCAAHSWNGGEGVPGGREQLIRRLTAWADAPEHSLLREQAARNQLAALMAMVADDLRSRAEQAKSRQVRAEQNQQRTARQAAQPWDGMIAELETRAAVCVSNIRAFAQEKQLLLLEKFQYELSHVNEPKRWWEEDSAYRLKTEMTGFSAAMEQEFTRNFSDDLRGINDTMARSYRQTLSVSRIGILDREAVEVEQDQQLAGLEDIQKKKMNFQVGRSLATAAGYVLLAGTGGPAAIVTSLCLGAGSTVLGEKMFRSSAEVQRKRVLQAVQEQVSRYVERAMEVAEGNIRQAYRRVGNEIRQKKELWLDTQLHKPGEAAEKESGSWERLLKETEQLIARLTGYQGGGTEDGAFCQGG